MSNINAKSVANYALMPGIMPRIRALFSSGFGSIAFLMAHIYNMVKLLPAHHPYLDKNNIGDFGIRHVIAEAANNLVIKKENWDQIIIFTALMTGFVLLIAQVALMIVAILFEPVFAQTGSIFTGSIFTTPPPINAAGDNPYSTDIAFLLLDRVFGIPGFFCAAGNVCTDILIDGRWPFHVALHSMFRFYSMGLLIIAVIIFLYFVVVIVGETATTGTPFGERFQNIWVPIRLVVALGLLTPINYGLNSGQYIGLFAAKVGSSLATNGWHRFNNTIRNSSTDGRANPTGESSNLLALPSNADLTPMVQFMSLAHACAYSEWRYDKSTEADGVTPLYPPGGKKPGLRDIDTLPTVPPKDDFYIKPYFIKSAISTIGAAPGATANARSMHVTLDTGYDEALDFYSNGDIIIRFGREVNSGKSSKYTGNIEPTCGELSIPISDLSYRNSDTEMADIDLYGGAPMVQRFYFNLVKQMWYGEGPSPGANGTTLNQKLLTHFSQRYAEFKFPEGSTQAYKSDPAEQFVCQIGCDNPELPSCQPTGPGGKYPCKTTTPDRAEFVSQIIRNYKAFSNTEIRAAWQAYNENGIAHSMSDEIYDRGWGGAGMWYNSISQINGGFVNAVFATPTPVAMPLIMEEIRDLKKRQDPNASGIDQYNPITSEKKDVSSKMGRDEQTKAAAMYSILKFWADGGASNDDEDKKATGNPFLDVMNFIFGTEGIFKMRGENAHIHPLAQLSAVGKGIVNSAIRNLGISTALSVLGPTINSYDSAITGPLASLGASLFGTTAFIGLTAGVVLFYILPLQPFIYFFFAVAGWVKGLFEAMVGIPLWALAHMRLDGEGLPGEAAQNGYFLILELFLRPILIVFGLIAASIIFAAQVRTLNFLWDLVIDNVGGFSGDNTLSIGIVEVERGIVDQFFFTIIYTIVVYMMASASFKLIDMIPDNIMRWAGNGVSAFGDSDKNPAAGLQRMAATGGLVQGQKIIGAGQEAAKGTGNLLEKVVGNPKPPPPRRP